MIFKCLLNDFFVLDNFESEPLKLIISIIGIEKTLALESLDILSYLYFTKRSIKIISIYFNFTENWQNNIKLELSVYEC